MLGVQAERMDIGPVTSARAREEPDGRAATEERDDDVGDPITGPATDGRSGTGRHRVAARGVADRMPLPLRVVAESLPAGVRSGEAGLQRTHAVVIGAVVLVGLVVALVSSGIGRPDVTPVGAARTPVDAAPAGKVIETGTPVPVSAMDQAPDQPPGTVVVHVAGKVARPGIVELTAGSRVVDAVEAAGGADDGVDLSTLNLARVLVDGEQVAVGIEPVAEPAPTGDAADPVVNINTATAAELESLPGIGPALAANIVAWRDEHGRFTLIEELQEVSGIGPAKFAALADQVTL